jgi:leader peptidase (prepilin peptidase)/N-methyltransferase
MQLEQLQPVFPFLALILGLCLGSFYNVCVHRYITNQSIIRPASHCPACGHKLAWWENLPLLSFLLLRGRCRACRQRISLRYPALEASSGLWAFALALKFGSSWIWLFYLFFGGILLLLSFIDLKSYILPDFLTLPGAILAFACSWLLPHLSWPDSLLGAVLGAGFFWFLQWAYKALKGVQGLGSGDIKLMLLLGALLGWQALPLSIFFAALSGLMVSLFYLYRSPGQGLQTAIPFGPFLSLGGMLYILLGPELMRWYLGLS